MNIFRALAAWLTTERRQLIQVWLGSLAPILIGLGYLTQADAEQWLIIVGASVQFAASLLSLVNLRGVSSVWTVIRGAIYALGMAVAPALTILGYIDEATSAILLTALSLGLSSLSSLLAIFTSSRQELALASIPRVQVSAEHVAELAAAASDADQALADRSRR